jgi:hypothetical protein
MYADLEHPTKCPVYCRKILMGNKIEKNKGLQGNRTSNSLGSLALVPLFSSEHA